MFVIHSCHWLESFLFSSCHRCCCLYFLTGLIMIGGRITTVYYNRLALRAHLKPYKFDILPRRARPPPKIIDYYRSFENRGELSPEMQLSQVRLVCVGWLFVGSAVRDLPCLLTLFVLCRRRSRRRSVVDSLRTPKLCTNCCTRKANKLFSGFAAHNQPTNRAQ